MSARDLQDVFAGLLRGHFEFILGCPVLNASDRCTGTEPVMHCLSIESNSDFNVTAAMHVQFDARRASVHCHLYKLINGFVGILKKNQHVGWKTVFFYKDGLNSTKTLVWIEFDMLDFT
jgi:hypothetical protein